MRVVVTGYGRWGPILDAHIYERSSNSFPYGLQTARLPSTFPYVKFCDFGGSLAQHRVLHGASSIDSKPSPLSAFCENQSNLSSSDAASEACSVAGASSSNWRTASVSRTMWGIHGGSYPSLCRAFQLNRLDRGALLCA